jgi:hypothetical protein
MEKKEDMKKRGVRSPDESDSLCLTFALPPSAYKKEEKETKEVIKGLAQSFNQKMLAMQKSRK